MATACPAFDDLVDPLGRLSIQNAAKVLAVTPKTMHNWKARGVGPKPFFVGGQLYYFADEVFAFGRGEVA